jgi:alkanesulfonate monooxygenase SsuD/methylene tetrahydromethanopterin reductase-like flavin-dependent oxidoreductase (luciferase family)
MRFGLLYEHQLPRPWTAGTEHRLFKDALAQVELADRLGIDHIWEVEHHFLEEYAHSSAPEVFLAACAARTRRIRIGHGVVLAPPGYNHPARVAERIATLDLISDGRVDWGTGESASRVELEGFGIDPEQKKAMWAEAVEQTANMMAMNPYPGFQGRYFSMPVRNVVPKPLQKPHPPIWVACSKRETIHAAARAGIGALTFAFVDPAEAGKWAREYYEIIKSDQCVPIGHTVNANIAMVTGFSVHEDAAEARRRGSEGFQFFGYSLGHFYVYGHHQPGVTNIWERFEAARGSLPPAGRGSGIGTPGELIQHLEQYQDAGVDQVVFIQQGGRNKHEHICQALELFAASVMPVLKAGQAERDARKQKELAPFMEAALKRKERMPPLAPPAIPTVSAYGRNVVQTDQSAEGPTHHINADIAVMMSDPADKKKKQQAAE